MTDLSVEKEESGCLQNFVGKFELLNATAVTE
jgi:hypothetical protein